MKIIVTAGPTREYIDPVRFLSNRSTGKMGYAIAEAAAQTGYETILISGPTALQTPDGVRRVDIVSARDMLDAILHELDDASVLIMSAAVADFRPATTSPEKLKKSLMQGSLTLIPNPDILKTLRPLKGNRIFIGFAAETGDPIPEAERKLFEKGLDMIVANDVSQPDSGFAVDTNRVTFLFKNGRKSYLPLLTKREVAERIIASI